jgi:hypothetical protein
MLLHEDYSWDTDEHDLGLMILSSPFEFNRNVQPIEYPKIPTEFSGLATVTGWGKLDQRAAEPVDRLQKVKIPIVRNSDCRAKYRKFKMMITDGMICAGMKGKDSCQGLSSYTHLK